MNLTLFVLVAVAISILVGWLTIPKIVIVAKKKRLFDTPCERKVHTAAIPRLGGISFFPSTLSGFCFALGLRSACGLDISMIREGQFRAECTLLSCGMIMLFIVGLAEDLIGVSPLSKFLVQFAAAITIILSNLYVKSGEGILGVQEVGLVFGMLVTILLVVFIINAFNLLDGVDGLCSGTGVIVLGVFAAWFLYLGEYVYGMLILSMVGILATFFIYNTLGGRLKIFMGDTGSLTLGLMIAFCTLKFINYGGCPYNVYSISSPLSIVIGLLFVPLFDTARLFITRIVQGKSPFSPDKNHIHHKLLALGFTHLQSTAILMSSTLGYLLLNILLSELLCVNINIILIVDLASGVAVIKYLEFLIAKKKTSPKSSHAKSMKTMQKSL